MRDDSPSLCVAVPSLRRFLDTLCGPRRDRDDRLDEAADELIEDFWRLSRDLDAVLTPEVRHDLLEFLRVANANRVENARKLVAWIDLVEEICLAVEMSYGDGTGAAKLQRVRSVIFQLTHRFLGDAPFPSLPAFARPFVTDLICRASVEFVVQLVNTPDRERSLWKESLTAAPAATPVSRLAKAGTRVTAKRWTIYEAIAGWLLKPPPLPRPLQAKLDVILAEWDAETDRTGKPPVQRVVQSIFAILSWVGRHGPELRRAIDALSIVTHWAYEFGDLSEAERIELIKRALSRYLDELGLGGSIFQRICELAIDLSVDAVVGLMRKRLALP